MLMKRLFPAAAALAIAVAASGAESADVLRIGGTGGALGMMTHMAAPFTAASGIETEILPSLGTNGSLRAAADGAIDVALLARKLKPSEAKYGLSVVPFARTALVFVTSHPKPNSWRDVELAGIFNSEIRKWKDGTPINIILRTKVDTDTEIIGTIFPGLRDALKQAQARPDVPVASTDQDNAELAQSLNGSFVQAGLSQMVTEKRKLSLVPINGIEPSIANLENGTYPYEKPFYMAFKPGNRNAEALAKFLHSKAGLDALRGTGSLPFSE